MSYFYLYPNVTCVAVFIFQKNQNLFAYRMECACCGSELLPDNVLDLYYNQGKNYRHITKEARISPLHLLINCNQVHLLDIKG